MLEEKKSERARFREMVERMKIDDYKKIDLPEDHWAHYYNKALTDILKKLEG